MSRKTKKEKIIAGLRRELAYSRHPVLKPQKDKLKKVSPPVPSFDYSYVKKDLLRISLLTITGIGIELLLYLFLTGRR